MKSSLVHKNYLFGTKISFLILSFLIVTIAITVQLDVWPFLQETLPVEQQTHAWSPFMIMMGLLVPLFWLYQDWQHEATRYVLISIVSMFILQIVTEALVSNYFFISMMIPTAILYTFYRIVQLITLQRIIYKADYRNKKAVMLRSILAILSVLFWGIVLFKLAFVIFPQIIPDLQ